MSAAGEGELVIAGRPIGPSHPAFLIAEAGINHNGCAERALALVNAAREAGADCVKFQLRDLATLYAHGGRPDDCREELGTQYVLDTLQRAHLDPALMARTFDHARASGIIPLCTPWDEESFDFLEDYGMPAYKVASADLTNHPLLAQLAVTGKPLIVSTGMSDEKEIDDAVALLRRHGARFALLHCVSAYPPADDEINLRYFERLRERAEIIGYSGHERGIAVAIAARALGASIIEKHLTLDHGLPGIDHKISLLPEEFAKLSAAIRQVERALGNAAPRRLGHGERINRESLAKSVVARVAIASGTTITDDLVAVRSPGNGLPPYRRSDLVGRRIPRAMAPGAPFFASDLASGRQIARRHRFQRPWGLPVRFHDCESLCQRFQPDFVEFHLSYRDLDEPIHRHLSDRRTEGLTVHAPDQFDRERTLDLASADPVERDAATRDLQRVVDLARALSERFAANGPVTVIANLGGFSSDGFIDKRCCPLLYQRIARSLAGLDLDGVRLLPQTLPPFPWHFGGRRYGNLFVDPNELAWFCQEFGYRLCLDISHSKLAANHLGLSIRDVIETLAPLAAHLHLSDAAGVDREGLQIGEGEIDFDDLALQLDRLAPGVGFLPEPWQGHHDFGEGFRVSLDRLEAAFGRCASVLAPAEQDTRLAGLASLVSRA